MEVGDSVFVFVATMLVWIMNPGIALFYGGMVKSKNVLNTAMHSYMPLAVISILWATSRYSLSFSEGNAFIGGLDWIGLNGVGFEPGPYSDTIPHSLFMLFQMTFAVLTVSIIAGRVAKAYEIFSLLTVYNYMVGVGTLRLNCTLSSFYLEYIDNK